MPLPKWASERPAVDPEDVFYLRAFDELASCRQVGFSAGPIPWTAIVEYADRLGLDAENAADLVDMIRELDEAWLTEQAKKRQTNTAASG